MSPSEIAGREIWYKATAGNARFHTYVFQQRVGVLVDWYRVLRADQRDDRFARLGPHQRPRLLHPGHATAVRRRAWTRPTASTGARATRSCSSSSAARATATRRAISGRPRSIRAIRTTRRKDQRQSSCDLAFGTSTGALGFRKFPNPRFDRARWQKLNGGLASWEGFAKTLSADPKSGGRARAAGSPTARSSRRS